MKKEIDYNEKFAELCERNIVLIPCNEIAEFWNYCAFRNVIPSGGAITNDCTAQYLYIDD